MSLLRQKSLFILLCGATVLSLAACPNGGIRMNDANTSDTGLPGRTPTVIPSTTFDHGVTVTTPSNHIVAFRFSPFTTRADSLSHTIKDRKFHSQTQNITGH